MTEINARTTQLASAAVFIAASIWGLYWVPLRLFVENGVDGSWTVVLLNTPPIIALLPLVFIKRDEFKEHFFRAMLIGSLAGAGLALYATGLVFSSVVRATLLFYLTPVWATLLGLLWLGERVGGTRWFVIALGLGGMLLLLSGGDSTSEPLNIGDLYGLLSGIFWAAAAAMMKRYPSTSLTGMTFFQFVGVAAIASLIGLITEATPIPEMASIIASLPVATIASIGLILPTVWIIFWAQRLLFPGRVGLLMMSEVLVAVISASIFLPEERMASLEWLGALLVIAACLIEVLATPTSQPRNRNFSRHLSKD
ncbi:MAG: DMT family transporter [Pseudomonadota bacterium]